MAVANSLRITEIFYSLQGETSRTGLPTVFVRLTGCPLRCGYCDSEYAFYGGETLSFDLILKRIATFSPKYICVTGGEPLAQKNCLPFLTQLCDAGYSVSLETSGALSISAVDTRVSCIVDLKTPGSGEVNRNLWENLSVLTQKDELKFVLCDETDYIWAKTILHEKQIDQRCPVIFSPVWETLKPVDLANWVIRDNLPVRVQVQLHKVLWGDIPGV
jgi:7-carboxy-7-deazaguanine synthase